VATRQPEAASTTRRRYESPRRLQHVAQTRAAVLDAAIRLFGEKGWAATGMRDVARVAGVAVETVYANFGSKTDLLLAALDVAVVGDIEPIPLGERPEFAALGRGTRSARTHAAAGLVRQIHERTYGIGRALRDAAAGDAELAKRLAELEARRRISVEQGAHLIVGGPVTETARDGLWAVLGMEVYQLLVDRAGWTPERYEEWLADTIGRLLRSDVKSEGKEKR
jgi:AcrR family transcriptional regulator